MSNVVRIPKSGALACTIIAIAGAVLFAGSSAAQQAIPAARTDTMPEYVTRCGIIDSEPLQLSNYNIIVIRNPVPNDIEVKSIRYRDSNFRVHEFILEKTPQTLAFDERIRLYAKNADECVEYSGLHAIVKIHEVDEVYNIGSENGALHLSQEVGCLDPFTRQQNGIADEDIDHNTRQVCYADLTSE